MAFFVYILECVDGTLYVGYTTNLEKREQRHQEGRGGAYTAARLPVRMVYSESFPTAGAARRRERQIKGWTHAKRAALVARDQESLRMLSPTPLR